MRIYTCVPEWEAMLTAIYTAFECKLGHNNLMLLTEPLEQMNLFDEYVHVDSDGEKAAKVAESIKRKISPLFYHEMATTAMAYESDALDNIYHMLILGFAYGPSVLDMLKFKDVMRNREIRKRIGNEACRFKEAIRFHQIGTAYIAHIEPKSRIAEYLGPAFCDRMPSENFIIVDDIHMDAVIHEANKDFYIKKLTADELDQLIKTENMNDQYTDLWKIFFETIAIKERENLKCQMNHSPLWARKHIVEFQPLNRSL